LPIVRGRDNNAASPDLSYDPGMAMKDALDRYLEGWNHGDGAAVVAALTSGGTYEDPTTGGPLTGNALAASVSAIATGFPDLSFDVVNVATTSDTSLVMQWVMRGTNTGPMPGGPATGGTIALPGVDLIDYDPGADRLSKVVGYFDSATMLAQLGLQAHITPKDMDGIAFGYGVRVDSGREAVPGAFTVTWIEIDEDYVDHLRDSTLGIVFEQLGQEAGYLGSFLASIGRRKYTFTAWTDVESARAALRGGAHAAAMRDARNDGFGANARGVTSLWTAAQMNGVFHPGPGKSHDLSELGGQWL
jgi:steroid delta-isomerase-like uncharacterized protein